MCGPQRKYNESVYYLRWSLLSFIEQVTHRSAKRSQAVKGAPIAATRYGPILFPEQGSHILSLAKPFLRGKNHLLAIVGVHPGLIAAARSCVIDREI
jgi:hypothetical protein